MFDYERLETFFELGLDPSMETPTEREDRLYPINASVSNSPRLQEEET